MQTFSKRTTRFLSLASISILLAFTFSCKKDSTNPNPSGGDGGEGGNTLPVIATADINFIPGDEFINHKYYKSGWNMIIESDSILFLDLKALDNQGNTIESPFIFIELHFDGKVEQGDVFNVSDFKSLKDNVLIGTVNENELNGYYSESIQLEVISISANQIKGTFSFSAVGTSDSNKNVEVTNGKFEGELVRI